MISGDRAATQVTDCVPETLCIAGAIPARTEAFVRTLRELGRPSTRRRVVKLGKPNQGIRRVDGPHGPVYEVTWAPEPGKVSRTTVSINRHGGDDAFLMALKIRRDKEREIYGAVL